MDAIAWDTAEKVAIRVAGREPLAESYHYASLEPDFREFTAEAAIQPAGEARQGATLELAKGFEPPTG